MILTRQASESDSENIYKLYLELLKSHPNAFIDSYNNELKKGVIDWTNDFTKIQIVIFLAEENENIIGMLALGYHDKDTNIPYVTKMGILPQYESKGVGSELLKDSIKYASKLPAKELRLFVMADMDKTISFYIKFGFTLLENLKNDIIDHTGKMRDVSIMQKVL
jgi:ribosomal protein S18 acetylase RimI-like enzyme